VTGYSECIDSFLRLRSFRACQTLRLLSARACGYFEPVIQEEARHILLFQNWAAWHRRTMPWYRRPWFELRVLAVWAFLGWERIGLARGMDDGKKKQDNNFTVTGKRRVSDVEVSVPELMDICLSENDRRFAAMTRACCGRRRCRLWCASPEVHGGCPSAPRQRRVPRPDLTFHRACP